MNAIVQIKITYGDSDATTLEDIRRTLDAAVRHLVDNGLLSGELKAKVEDWSHDIYVEGTPEYIGYYKEIELLRKKVEKRRANTEDRLCPACKQPTGIVGGKHGHVEECPRCGCMLQWDSALRRYTKW